MEQQGNAFTLFQTAINLESRIKARTEELRATLRRLEQSNVELVAAKENAERANLSKTRFLAAASHDVLQPLNAAHLSISALADLQASEEGRQAGAPGRALAGDHGRSAAHAARHFQARCRRRAPGHRRRRAGAVVCGAALGLPAAGGEEGPEAAVSSDRACGRRSDRTLLSRILQNIVSNALRYTRKRRRAGRRAPARRNGADRVADTGCGIPEDQHQAIYEEFHRGP